MKIILLEHPRSITPERCNDIANTPLSSCLISGYAAGMLKKCGHDVEIIEGYLDRLTYGEIENEIRSIKPDILGVHMVYHWRQDHELFGFLENLKDRRLASTITAYGFYATIAADNILKQSTAVDSVISGETEMTFPALAEAASTGLFTPFLPGLSVRYQEGIRCTRRRPVKDLDEIPFPVRTEAQYRLPEVNILGSRGCYGRCTFCYINSFYGTGVPWRGRSPENIASEIAAINAERRAGRFYFTDPNFFGPGLKGQERALKIAALLKPMNIFFGIEGRVNDIHDKTIGRLVDAGLRHILVGLESGRDESLKRMNKMTTVDQNEQALRVLRRHGIEPNVGFIMFEPDSSLEDIRINFEFLKRNDLLANLPVTANVLYHHQIVLEGTEAYHMLKREGRLQLRDSSYEGNTCLKTPGVAALANIMRGVTNVLFSRMAAIWSGKIAETPDTRRQNAEINRILVDTFENCLCQLEAGEQFDDKHIRIMAQNAEREINGSLNKSYGSDD
ncbi:MAG: B12-binding domain-containing radical SAM protein [Nitrospirae bacterium]|nr:B12-binding domain-containing radical SAM protein [Nitrospirota bacterium]